MTATPATPLDRRAATLVGVIPPIATQGQGLDVVIDLRCPTPRGVAASDLLVVAQTGPTPR